MGRRTAEASPPYSSTVRTSSPPSSIRSLPDPLDWGDGDQSSSAVASRRLNSSRKAGEESHWLALSSGLGGNPGSSNSRSGGRAALLWDHRERKSAAMRTQATKTDNNRGVSRLSGTWLDFASTEGVGTWEGGGSEGSSGNSPKGTPKTGARPASWTANPSRRGPASPGGSRPAMAIASRNQALTIALNQFGGSNRRDFLGTRVSPVPLHLGAIRRSRLRTTPSPGRAPERMSRPPSDPASFLAGNGTGPGQCPPLSRPRSGPDKSDGNDCGNANNEKDAPEIRPKLVRPCQPPCRDGCPPAFRKTGKHEACPYPECRQRTLDPILHGYPVISNGGTSPTMRPAGPVQRRLRGGESYSQR